MRTDIRYAGLALAAALLATPAVAQAQARLEVPASKKWRHAGTGLIVPQALAGMPRTTITDAGADELDVSAQFGDAETTQLTLYIFRPALASVPVWFDRVETQILGRDAYGRATPAGDPIAFAPPFAGAPAALRRVYVPGKPPYTATGAAMLPLGEWLVAARLSSTRLDPAALDAKLVEIVAGLGWPAPAANAPALPPATPVQPCATPLAFDKKAKLRKPDMSAAILGALLSGMARDPEVEKTVTAGPRLFCREGAPKPEMAAYQAMGDGERNSYLIAIGDAGRVIHVYPEIALDKSKPGFAITLGDLAASYVFPAFDKLPAPDKVVEMVRKTSPISSSKRGAKELTITVK